MKRILGIGLCAALAFAVALPAAAGASGGISNWAAPSTWSASPGGRTALAVSAAPLPFIPIAPCRMADTRAGSGFPSGYGPPSMTGGLSRAFTITGKCGIPTSAVAVSFNFAVWNTTSYGDFAIYPTGTPATVSTLNWSPGVLALANAAVVPLGTSGQITVVNEGSGTVDLFFDVNGYYAATQPTATTFFINTPSNYAIWGTSTASTGYGVLGYGGSSGVGVYGSGGTGVFGTSSVGNGVLGQSTAAGVAGVLGQNGNNADGTHGVGGYAGGTGKVFGVQGQIGTTAAAGSAGVHGIGASVVAGKSYAVFGETADSSSDSSAVQGSITGAGAAVGIPAGWVPGGIRGDGKDNGVWGFSNTYAVFGRAYTAAGVTAGYGILGDNATPTTTYGVHGGAGTSGTTNWAVYASGNMGASGAKPFVEPHPTQAGMVIRYVALEGPEAGTYFRGRGRFVGRQAVIEVPEDFRLVTDTEGLSIQVTPIGDLSQVAVVSIGLDSIELKSSRDVEFFYHVNGIRRTFKDWKVTVQSNEFMPDGPSAKMPDGLSAEQRLSLVRNGTYNEDGTPNMTTARRLGWDVEWSHRSTQNFGKVVDKTQK